MIIREWNNGILTETGTPDPPQKSIYSIDEFIALIPKAKIREIQAAAETNDDINMWVFNLPMLKKVDLNNLPQWFLEGIATMVTAEIFTQNQANNFLEL